MRSGWDTGSNGFDNAVRAVEDNPHDTGLRKWRCGRCSGAPTTSRADYVAHMLAEHGVDLSYAKAGR